MRNNDTHNNKAESTSKIGDEICLPDSKLPRVIIIGGGFAGLALVEKLVTACETKGATPHILFSSSSAIMVLAVMAASILLILKLNLILLVGI